MRIHMEELEELEQLDDSEITAMSPTSSGRVSVPPPIPKQALERSSFPPQRSSLPAAPPPAGTSSAPPSSGIFRIDDAAGLRASSAGTTSAAGRISAPLLPPRPSGTSPGISPLQLELDHLKRQVRELELKVRLRDDLIAELKRSLEDQRKALARAEAMSSTSDAAQRPAPVDDLKRIRGIGPTFERKLHALEITRFAQIASWNEADVERIAQALQILPQRVERDGWIESAARLVAE
jgi:predicted flap endonuclease-1-like 5' DNA nuclease